MTTSVSASPLRTPRLVVAILVIAVVATPVLAFPYVLLDRAASRIYVQADAAWVLLVIHVPCAAAAMILGALQSCPGSGRTGDATGSSAGPSWVSARWLSCSPGSRWRSPPPTAT
jgi:hypothetical protein